MSLFAYAKGSGTQIKLTANAQLDLQNYFRAIYEKIRIPEDPIVMPEIVLVSGSDSNAYVFPNNRSKIYFNIDYLKWAASDDVIAGTLAHELTHLQVNQGERRALLKVKARFGNELEAQSTGIIKRISRWNILDPRTHKHQEAVYSLEAIIKAYESDSEFRNEYANYKSLGAALKVFFAQDRYRRVYPQMKSSGVPRSILSTKTKTPTLTDSTRKSVSAIRERMSRLGSLFGKSSIQKLESLWKSYQTEPQNRDEAVAQLFTLLDQEQKNISFVKKIPHGMLAALHSVKDPYSPSTSIKQMMRTDLFFKAINENDWTNPLFQEPIFEFLNYVTYSHLQTQCHHWRDNLLKKGWPNETPPRAVLALLKTILEMQDVDKRLKKLANEEFQKLLLNNKAKDYLHHLPSVVVSGLLAKSSDAEILGFDGQLTTSDKIEVCRSRPFLMRQFVRQAKERGDFAFIFDVRQHFTDNNLDRELAESIENSPLKKEPNESIDLVEFKERNIDYRRASARMKQLIDFFVDNGHRNQNLRDVMYASIDFPFKIDKENSLLRPVLYFSEKAFGSETQSLKNFPLSYQSYLKLAADNIVCLLSRSSVNYSNGKDSFTKLPMDDILPMLSNEKFLILLAFKDKFEVNDENGVHSKLTAAKKEFYISAFSREFLKRARSHKLNDKEQMIGFRLLTQIPGAGAFIELKEILGHFFKKVAQSKDPNYMYEYISSVPPTLFDQASDYVDHVTQLLEDKCLEVKSSSSFYQRQSKLAQFTKELSAATVHVDPQLKQLLLDKISEKIEAFPREKKALTVDPNEHLESGYKAAELMALT